MPHAIERVICEQAERPIAMISHVEEASTVDGLTSIPITPETVSSDRNTLLGNLQIQKGSYEEAISTLLEGNGIFQKIGSGQTNLFTFYGKSYLSQAYMFKGDYEKTAEARARNSTSGVSSVWSNRLNFFTP